MPIDKELPDDRELETKKFYIFMTKVRSSAIGIHLAILSHSSFNEKEAAELCPAAPKNEREMDCRPRL